MTTHAALRIACAAAAAGALAVAAVGAATAVAASRAPARVGVVAVGVVPDGPAPGAAPPAAQPAQPAESPQPAKPAEPPQPTETPQPPPTPSAHPATASGALPADPVEEDPPGLAGGEEVLAAATRPAAGTTGVVPGVQLSPMAGGTVPASGTIADKVITGDVVFTGSNLTVRNVRVTGHAVFRGDDLVIEDSEFGSWALSGTARVRAARIEVFGNPGQDGLHVTSGTGPVSDVVVEDSWIHDPRVVHGSHYDGIQVRGATGLTIRRTVVDLGAYQSGYNGALFLEDANGGNRDVVVEDSWLLGGGYTVAVHAEGVRITGTTVAAGRWGYLNPTSSPLAEFSGNLAPDGRTLLYAGGSVVAVTDPLAVCPPGVDAVTARGPVGQPLG